MQTSISVFEDHTLGARLMWCGWEQVEIVLLQLRSASDVEGAVEGLEILARVAWADEGARGLVEGYAGVACAHSLPFELLVIGNPFNSLNTQNLGRRGCQISLET